MPLVDFLQLDGEILSLFHGPRRNGRMPAVKRRGNVINSITTSLPPS